MVNENHLARLQQGVDTWNRWRNENRATTPDLREGDLQGAALTEARLLGADPLGANLTEADLSGANLTAEISHENRGYQKFKKCS
jgi:uncharacterized protein YjbI with pentapeptide repeats